MNKLYFDRRLAESKSVARLPRCENSGNYRVGAGVGATDLARPEPWDW